MDIEKIVDVVGCVRFEVEKKVQSRTRRVRSSANQMGGDDGNLNQLHTTTTASQCFESIIIIFDNFVRMDL